MRTISQPGNTLPWFQPEPGDREYKYKSVCSFSDQLSRPSIYGSALKSSRDIARRRNTIKAFRALAKSGINDLRERMRYAQIAGSFMPGIGTGTAASLGAANALAAGRPITTAIIKKARSAVSDRPPSRIAFDTGIQLARGRNLSHAALATARNQLPPGARSAFDTAIALGKGQSLQIAALRGAGYLSAPSPYVNHPLSFARHALRGRNLQQASFSRGGRRMYQRLRGEVDFEIPDEFTLPASYEEMTEIRRRLRGSRIGPRRSRPRHPHKTARFGKYHGGSMPKRPVSRPRSVRRPIKVRSLPHDIHALRYSSEFIRWVQQALNDVLGRSLVVDGIPDLATRDAIRDFQRKYNLPVDGIAGPATKERLVKARADYFKQKK